MAADDSITLMSEQPQSFSGSSSKISRDDASVPHCDDLSLVNSTLSDYICAFDYLADDSFQPHHNLRKRTVPKQDLNPLKELSESKNPEKIPCIPEELKSRYQDPLGGLLPKKALSILSAPPQDAKPGTIHAPWPRLTDRELAQLCIQKRAKRSCIPSRADINRELQRLGRGLKHRLQAKSEAERIGGDFVDCDDPAPTSFKDLNTLPSKITLPPQTVSRSATVIRGWRNGSINRSIRKEIELPTRARSIPCQMKRDPISQDLPFGKNKSRSHSVPSASPSLLLVIKIRDWSELDCLNLSEICSNTVRRNSTMASIKQQSQDRTVFYQKSHTDNIAQTHDLNGTDHTEVTLPALSSIAESGLPQGSAVFQPLTSPHCRSSNNLDVMSNQKPMSKMKIARAKRKRSSVDIDGRPLSEKGGNRSSKQAERRLYRSKTVRDPLEQPSHRNLKDAEKGNPTFDTAGLLEKPRSRRLAKKIKHTRRGEPAGHDEALRETITVYSETIVLQDMNRTNHRVRSRRDQSFNEPSSSLASGHSDVGTRTRRAISLCGCLDDTNSPDDSRRVGKCHVHNRLPSMAPIEPSLSSVGPTNPFSRPEINNRWSFTPQPPQPSLSSAYNSSDYISLSSQSFSNIKKGFIYETSRSRSLDPQQNYLPSPNLRSLNGAMLPSIASLLGQVQNSNRDNDHIYEDNVRRSSGRVRKQTSFFIKEHTTQNLPRVQAPLPSNKHLNIPTTPRGSEKRKRKAVEFQSKPRSSPTKRAKLSASHPSSTDAVLSTPQTPQDKHAGQLYNLDSSSQHRQRDITTNVRDDVDKNLSGIEERHNEGFSPALLGDEVGTSPTTILAITDPMVASPQFPSPKARKGKHVSPTKIRTEPSPRKRQTPVKLKPAEKISLPPRPQPYGSPSVWADDRQALCDSLPYYRAFQSGAYTSDGLAHGFLLDKDTGSRPYMDEEVVITRAGGGCGKNEEGEMRQLKSHSSDNPAIKSFRKNMTRRVPLVLIVGKDNASCPVEIQHQYCVMGWFQVTDVWAEKENELVVYRYRFEKLDLSTKSWWASRSSPDPAFSPVHPPTATRATCIVCRETYPQVFAQDWICLNPNCAVFWTMDRAEPPTDLSYNIEFLKERKPWPKEIKPAHDLKPSLLEPSIGDDPAYVYCRAGWKGMACPHCGRCSSRRYWDSWRCDNPRCAFVYKLRQPILSPRQVMNGHSVEYSGHALPMDDCSESLNERPTKYIGDWRISTYDLMDGNVVTHFQANKTINTAKGGAHDLFVSLQKDNCMGLQRFSKPLGIIKGESLANHFSMNFGLPYEYHVASGSKRFADAPLGILSALKRLTWAGKTTVEDGVFKPFNECLAVGYFEQSKMEYHDDGEITLGPTIATLSLGGSAKMTLRMKSRYYSGCTASQKYCPSDPVLPGCLLEEARRKLNSLYGQISEEGFESRTDEMYKAANLKRVSKPSPVLLTMALEHGDIVIMHGGEMQKYYEHKVVSSDKMRFALTFRHIKPELVDSSLHHMGDYDASLIDDYNGDTEETAAAAIAGSVQGRLVGDEIVSPKSTITQSPDPPVPVAVSVEQEVLPIEVALPMQGLMPEPSTPIEEDNT